MLDRSVATALFTIGYEGRSLDEVIGALLAKKIDRVIDIRELPLSRRRGFSKTPLGTALGAKGIEYVHLKIAGNPYRREKDEIPRDLLLAKYSAHLADAPEVVDATVEAVRGHRAALLCYEADCATCHRSILAPPVAEILRLRARVQDL